MIVAKDGTGDFKTIQEAVEHLRVHPELELKIEIKEGVYDEQVTFDIHHLIIEGEGPDKTIITGARYGLMPCETYGKLGTFRTFTVLVDGNCVTMRQLTIENTSGKGEDVGQAIALYAEGDQIVIEHCVLKGHQDTLFTGPLPPKEIVKNGFIGPKQHAPRINGIQKYRHCHIVGDIDFIFGSATAYFENCIIESLARDDKKVGYITAASTPEGQDVGYVFEQCQFVGEAQPGSVYLGRPWRHYAKTVIKNSYLGEHIHPEGWHDWGKTDAHATIFYLEVDNEGPGSSIEQRPAWVRTS